MASAVPRTRRFLLFWAGDAVSAAGSAVTLVALPLLALGTLEVSDAGLGVLRASQTLPFLLLAVPVGLLVDRVSRRRLMLGADACRAVLVGAIALCAVLGVLSLPLLVGLALAVGVGAVVHEVSYLSALPDLLDDRRDLPRANRAVEMTHAGAWVAGPGAGGALVAATSAAAVLVLDAVSFAVSAVLLALARWRDRLPTGTPGGPTPRRRRGGVSAGWSFVRRSGTVGPLTAYLGVSNLAAQAFQTALLLLAVRTLALGPALVGLVVAAQGLGFLAGALASLRLAGTLGLGRLVCLAPVLAAAGIGTACVASSGGWAVAALGSALAGAGPGLINLQSISLRQAVTPAALLGRVTAAVKLVSYSASTAGALLGGALAGVLGPRAVLAAAAALTLAAAAVLVLSPVRRLRHLPDEDDAGVR